MAIDLYRHNQEAYSAALAMLSDCGKAAVIHPTGTGKSFIGFKLCEEHPASRICWLSPSEYIFKTQLENIQSAADGWQPENISFFTYAKLMLMNSSELEEIRPDYIILDEFHRCGAEMWGQGVQNLLALYPQVPLLGLSATNIRYLDNQRNMADELFDGHIASEMTLGEAIVRGILNPPKYVLSVFSYQKDLEKYQHRVKRAKNKAVRDEAEKHLEALRRALEKADGLDVLFQKHMSDPGGKYIVFCSNVEHMRDMMVQAKDWFTKVDADPHFYAAYSDNPETSSEFEAFKQDNSDHLKLLFCIDMLNEGVHVEDVSGVILLRPTVSPIIYKQQIGRALSASKRTNAVIFDIVLNIENLYSIDAIEEEMQIATVYYREHGESEEIINEHFQIVDEVHDCMELFERLNDTLGASWELMYTFAETYYKENGNLDVPKRYVTPEGYSLGSWLMTQRKVYAGKADGKLQDWQIEKLNALGMRWESASDASWAKYYAAAEEYYRQNGHLKVPATENDFCGVALGRWVAQLRTYRRSGINNAYLTPERIETMNGIGMVWDVPDYVWTQNYNAALNYYKKHGNLKVPYKYVSPDGIKLWAWLNRVSRAERGLVENAAPLTSEQRAMLDELGMVWGKRTELLWEQGYQAACDYFAQYGNLEVPHTYITADGVKLGRWIFRQRELYPDKVDATKQEKLNRIGMVWTRIDPWEEKIALVEQYYADHGNANIPADYVVDGVWIARWLAEQVLKLNGKTSRRNRKSNELTPERIARLERVGIRKNVSKSDVHWEENCESVKQFVQANGHMIIPRNYKGNNGKLLSPWVLRQRKAYSEGRLTEEQIEKLDAIGMVWVIEDPWKIGYQHAVEYRAEFGDLDIPGTYVSKDGYNLGTWLRNQRSSYSSNDRNKLSEEEIGLLNQLGMVWSVAKSQWENQYEALCDFLKQNGDLKVPRDYMTKDGAKLIYWIELQRENRRSGKLPEEKIQKLDAIGFDWMTPLERSWETAYQYARAYRQEFGDLDAKHSYRTPEGFCLRRWLDHQRQCKEKLTALQISRLDAIGMVWEQTAGRASGKAQEYKKELGVAAV